MTLQSSLRVMHVITSLDDGGAEAVLHRLVANDSADVHHVVSLTGDGKYASLLREVGVEVTALGMPRGRVTLMGWRGLRKVLRQLQPEVMQTWMYHSDFLGGLAGRLARVPVVWGVHHTALDPGRSSRGTIWVARLCAWMSRWVPRRIVVCAESAKDAHKALGYDAGRMVVVPNGYDLSRFAPDVEARARLRAEWSVPVGQPLVGMVARFNPTKDHANLVAALGRLKDAGVDFRVVLVGTGMNADNGELTTLVTEAGLAQRICLLGPRTDIPAIMNALDLHVLSSAAEAFPNVLAEAMACGTPCVTTDVGDAARIVGSAGWVVRPHDSAALADGLALALQAWSQRERWSVRQQRARRRIEDEFGIETMVERYRDIWTQVSGRIG